MSRPAASAAQLLGPVDVEDLRLAAARDRHQIPEPEAHQLQAQIERGGVRPPPRAPGLQLELALESRRPRFGSFASRSASSS